jgi:hypothetical protein
MSQAGACNHAKECRNGGFTLRKLRLHLSLGALLSTCLFLTSPASAQSPDAVVPPAIPAAAPSEAPTGRLLPGGTTVTVALLEAISSGTAHEGDQIGIVARKAVRVNGSILIAEGANGHATVTSVEGSGGNGSGGKLAISIDWIDAVDGGKVKLTQTNHASESGDTKGAASTATIATYLLLGPLGLFAHNFVHGRDATIDTKKNFTVFVDHDVYIKDAVADQGSDQFAPR